MRLLNKLFLLIPLVLIFVSCQESDNLVDVSYDYNYYNDYSIQKEDCNCDDGSKSATVDYYDPNTRNTKTYSTDIEIEDCKVTSINLPKLPTLNNSRISPSEIDRNGSANFVDEKGRTFKIQLKDDFLLY